MIGIVRTRFVFVAASEPSRASCRSSYSVLGVEVEPVPGDAQRLRGADPALDQQRDHGRERLADVLHRPGDLVGGQGTLLAFGLLREHPSRTSRGRSRPACGWRGSPASPSGRSRWRRRGSRRTTSASGPSPSPSGRGRGCPRPPRPPSSASQVQARRRGRVSSRCSRAPARSTRPRCRRASRGRRGSRPRRRRRGCAGRRSRRRASRARAPAATRSPSPRRSSMSPPARRSSPSGRDFGDEIVAAAMIGPSTTPRSSPSKATATDSKTATSAAATRPSRAPLTPVRYDLYDQPLPGLRLPTFARRGRQRFCSNTCRQRAYRQRGRQTTPTTPSTPALATISECGTCGAPPPPAALPDCNLLPPPRPWRALPPLRRAHLLAELA